MKLKSLQVNQAISYAKRLIENDPILYNIKIKGEISSFKIHSSGNVFLTLKDEKSTLKSIIFKSDFLKINNDFKQGDHIEAQGYISIYEFTSDLQFYIQKIEKEGLGELYKKFLNLKIDLELRGYFKEDTKQKLPQFPQNIGVITSETGSVIQDIKRVLAHRYPAVKLFLYPSLVQGNAALENLISGITYFNKSNSVDVIILARGGGSIEDLWVFNEEKLADSIKNSKIPIVSAIGHETDFTISDFVADKRASTPTAAAEMVVPDQNFLKIDLNQKIKFLNYKISKILEYKNQNLEKIEKELKKESQIKNWNEKMLTLDLLKENLDKISKQKIYNERKSLDFLRKEMVLLNPLNILDKGYSILEDSNKNKIINIDQIKLEEELNIRLKNGKLKCLVKEIDKEKLI